jgi:hypothetical protein
MKITSIEDISNAIEQIWNSENINQLAKDMPWLKSRGYIFATPSRSDLLITGINPSFKENSENDPKGRGGSATVHFQLETWLKENKRRWDPYFGPLRKMLVDEQNDINLMERFDYLDIFHYKYKQQAILTQKILKSAEGISFIADELNLTQHIIEDVIKPKLILVMNKETHAYWGKLKDKGFVWMGYNFEKVRDYDCGELCKITELQESNERIAPEITNENTSLKGTYVLFSKHINQFTKREERPTAVIVNDILNEITSK